MSDKVVQLNAGPQPSPVDVLAAVLRELAAEEHCPPPQLALVLARSTPGETSTEVYVSGNVRDLVQALGVLSLGKAELLRLSNG